MVSLGYAFICIVFGTTFLAIKMGLNEGIPPIEMAALRFILAALLAIGYTVLRKHTFPKRFKDYCEIALLGILMTSIPFAALFWAESYISSGTAALLVATAPVFIGLISSMDRSQWGGFLLSALGIFCIVSPDLHDQALGLQPLLAKVAIIASEFCFAYGAVRSKRVLMNGISSLQFNGLQMLFASVVLFVLSFLTEHPLQTRFTPLSIYCLLYLSVVASILASGVYYWLVKVINPLFPTTWTYVSPVIALISGYFILHEPATKIGVVGAILVIGGVLIINRSVFLSLWQERKNKLIKHEIGA